MPATIPHALSEAARRHGGRPALIGQGVQLTHAQLDAAVARAAAGLAAAGIETGTIVGVSMGTSPLHFVTLLALARLGAGSVHVRPDYPKGVKDALAAQFSIVGTIGDPGQGAAVSADTAWLEPGKAPDAAIQAKPDSPWRIALSSGTTGLQKGVLLRHAESLDYFELRARALPVTGSDRFLCHRGLDAQLTLNPAVRSLLAGGVVVFPASLSLDHFIEAVERHGVTQAAMSPAYLRDLVARAPAGGFRFPSLLQLQLAGSKVPPDLMEAALASVTENLVVAYGAAEVGLLALADTVLLRSAPESVGRLAPGVQAEAVGEAGELRFRRPGMATEYFGNPAASAKAFRDGWFHPGDTGRIEDGLLILRGRIDDKLNLDGMKIDPEPIERALQSHPAVIEAAAFAAALDGGRPALFAAAVLRGPADEKALIAHVRARVGPMYTPARIFFAKDLPRNDRGKLQRSDLAQRVGRRPRA